MKNNRLFITTVFIFFVFIGCNEKETIVANNFPTFKIGQEGMEEVFKEKFDYEKLSIGFSTKKGMIGNAEKRVRLTFKKQDIFSVSDSLLIVYSEFIKNHVHEQLLNKSNYDVLIIRFEQSTVFGNLTKSSSIQIKETL
ncbi:hypothetical protein [Polaribacter tangerinus]|uniref:hypothetical protein n=1 Tax=Polaribacter tangerinus TaxID=1920034 RepID=UPI00117E13F8|nr:hypothetical protein [Polaribacter tangerinus]